MVGGPWTDGSATLDACDGNRGPGRGRHQPHRKRLHNGIGAGRTRHRLTPCSGPRSAAPSRPRLASLPNLTASKYSDLGIPSSYYNSSGIPYQMTFGWVASTGRIDRYHEIRNVVVSNGTGTPPPTFALAASDNKSGEFGQRHLGRIHLHTEPVGRQRVRDHHFHRPVPGRAHSDQHHRDRSFVDLLDRKLHRHLHSCRRDRTVDNAEHRHRGIGRIQREHGVRCARRPWIRLGRRRARCRRSRSGHRLRDRDGYLTVTQQRIAWQVGRRSRSPGPTSTTCHR